LKTKKTGVHAIGEHAFVRGQGDVHGIGMTAKVRAGFKQGDIGLTLKAVRHSQA